jgi:predicted nucleic acid-binding protein
VTADSARIHLDTDVLLDALQDRQPHARDSGAVWALIEKGHQRGTIAAISMANIFYLVRRAAGAPAARQAVQDLCRVFTILPCDDASIHAALATRIADFEDALQYVAAERAQVAAIITRNIRDYPRKGIPVMTPTAFLASGAAPQPDKRAS